MKQNKSAQKTSRRPASTKASGSRYASLPEPARKVAAKVVSTKQSSRDFLVRAGIATKTGRLTKQYS